MYYVFRVGLSLFDKNIQFLVGYDQFTILNLQTPLSCKITSKLLFKQWSEPIVKIETYHPYRQFVEIIWSISMSLRLLWLPFNGRYKKPQYIMG